MLDLPSFDQTLAAPAVAPALPPPAPPKSNAFVAGLKSGTYSTGAALAGLGSGAAKLIGANGLSASLGQKAAEYNADAAQVGRDDIDRDGWTGGGLGGFLAKGAYTIGQSIPGLVGAGAAGVAATAALPEEAAVAGGAGIAGLAGRLGASLPTLFGGSGLGAGFGAEALGSEALYSGARAAATLAGTGAVMGAQSTGEQINEAAKQPGGLTTGNVLKAAALGLPIGLAQGLVPGEGALLARGALGASEKGVLGTALDHGFKNAAAGAVGSGLQTAADTSYDPNMTPADRASAIVQAVVGGAQAGGLLGGAMGALHGLGGPKPTPENPDAALKAAGLDPTDPAATSPTPATPPPGPPAPEPVQQELPLATPLSAQPADSQATMFDLPSYDPGKIVPRAQRSDASVRTEIQAAIDARQARAAAQPVEPTTSVAPADQPIAPATLRDALRQADAPPANAFAQQTIADAGIKVGRGSSDFKDFIASSTATNPAELYNELLAVDPTSKAAQSSQFTKLATRLGVGDNTLDAQLAALQANPDTANVKALSLVNFKLGLRDAAAQLRERPADPTPEEVKPEAVPAPAAAVAEPTPAQAAPSRPIAAPTLLDDIPGLEPDSGGVTPSVRPSEGAQDAQAGTQTATAEPPAPDIVAQMNALLGRASAPAADAGPKSITDRVLDVARSAVGDKGGEVTVADIRKALPDVAAKDVDAALREIHNDDSDTTLVQNPKGERTGGDAVSVPGSGRFHKLDLEARDDGVQIGSAAPEADPAPAASDGGADGGADAAGAEAPGAVEAPGAPEGLPGADPAQGAGAAAPLTKEAASNAASDQALAALRASKPGRLDANTPYPGDAAKAAELGVTLPPRTDANGQGYDAVAHRLLWMHNAQVDGKQGSTSFAAALRDARSTFGQVSDPSATLQPLPVRTKLAPQDPSVRSPAQLASDAGRQDAAERLIAAPPAVKAAADRTSMALRRQAKTKTAMIETPDGDQVPTDTVGATAADLPQASVSVPDMLTTTGKDANPSEMAKVPQDVMPGVTPTVMPRADVQAHFDRLVGKLSPDVRDRVHLLGGQEAIEGRSEPMGPGTLGLYRNGQVYVNADAVRTRADLEDTLSHEVFGHLGNSADLGGIAGRFDEGRYQARMNGILQRAGGLDGIEALARKNGVWSQFEDGGNLNGGAGLRAYFPPDGRAPTPFESARLVDELIAHAAGTDKLGGVIQTVQASVRKAIVNTLRRAGLHEFARRMDRFGQPELADWLKQTRAALTAQPRPGDVDMLAGSTTPRQFLRNAEPVGEAPFMARMAAQQRDSEGVLGAADSLRNHLINNVATRALLGTPDAPGVRGKAVPEVLKNAGREVVNSIMPANHFVEQADRIGLKTLRDHFEAGKAQDTAQTHINGATNRVAQNQMNLRIADAAQETRLNRVMALATTNNLDPTRPLAQHSWLTPAEVQSRGPAYAEMKAEYDKLGKPGKGGKVTGGQQVYRDQVAAGQMNWYMARAMANHDIMRSVFEGKIDRGYDPVRRYMGADGTLADGGRSIAEGLHGQIGPSRDFWQAEFQRSHDLLQAHMTEQGGAQGNAGTKSYVDLAQHLKDNTEGEQANVKQGAYFRLDRTGEHAVGFTVKPEVDADGKPTGRPDPAALDALAAGLSKKFPNLSIGANRENGRVFARFVSEEQASNFHALVAKDGPLYRHIDQEKGTHVSLLTEAQGADDKVPFMQEMMDKARTKFDADLARLPENDPQRAGLAAARDKFMGNLRATIMDQMGDTSMRSIQSRRDNVQGFNADMLTGQKNAASTFARAAAATSFRTDKANAMHSVQEKIDAAGHSGTKDAVAKAADMKRVLNAYNDRQTAADVRTGPSYLSTVKSWMHTYQLGFSPAYFVMNLSQLGTTGLPELAKMHGFARSMQAMIGSMPEVGRMIHAMATTRIDLGDGSKGPLAMHEGGITPVVLNRARLSPEMRAHISDLANHGHLEMGSYSAANSGLGLGSLSRLDRWRQYGSSTALLAETTSRLVMAVAAKRLHDETIAAGGTKADSLARQFPHGAVDYAGHAIQEGMFQWGSYNTPKLFTKGGALGSLGPIVTQFHGFIPRLVEKLHRESMDGFTQRLGTGPEADAQRAEARRFVMAHLAGTMAIAGGLGLPMAGYTAAAATKLSGLILNQPYDVEAHMRAFLAENLGKDAGEILSRGLPRYLGVDLSDLGDDGIGPMSRLMEDRRKMEDALPAYLAHAWGSAPGAALNMLVAAREMTEGRFAEAGARALPTVFRNGARAYRLSELGYVNDRGEKLPVPAGAAEVLKTALGFTGGQLAEEKDRQEVLDGRREDQTYRKAEIMKKFAQAGNDPAARNEALDEARQFNKDNPGVDMLGQVSSQLQSRARAQAMGARVGTMGFNPKDKQSLGLIGF